MERKMNGKYGKMKGKMEWEDRKMRNECPEYRLAVGMIGIYSGFFSASASASASASVRDSLATLPTFDRNGPGC
jgi:hypothetical protein